MNNLSKVRATYKPKDYGLTDLIKYVKYTEGYTYLSEATHFLANTKNYVPPGKEEMDKFRQLQKVVEELARFRELVSDYQFASSETVGDILDELEFTRNRKKKDFESLSQEEE